MKINYYMTASSYVQVCMCNLEKCREPCRNRIIKISDSLCEYRGFCDSEQERLLKTCVNKLLYVAVCVYMHALDRNAQRQKERQA